MCGGEMEIVPCSKVGHVYKQKNVYTYPKGIFFQILWKSRYHIFKEGGTSKALKLKIPLNLEVYKRENF